MWVRDRASSRALVLETEHWALQSLSTRVWKRSRVPLAILGFSILAQLAGRHTSLQDQVMWWVPRWAVLTWAALELWHSLTARRVVVDGESGEVVVEERDTTGLLSRRRVYRIADVVRLRVRNVRPGRLPFAGRHCGLEFELGLVSGNEARVARFVDPEDYAPRPMERYELIARMGRHLGLESWRLDWCDSIRFQVSVGRSDLEDGAPLPPAGEPSEDGPEPPLCRWGRGERGGTLDTLRSEYQVEAWDPGKAVAFRRRAQPIVVGFWMVLFWLLAALSTSEFRRDGEWVLEPRTPRGYIFALVTLFPILMMMTGRPARGWIDWSRGQVTSGHWPLRRTLPLAQVRGIRIQVCRANRYLDCDRHYWGRIARVSVWGGSWVNRRSLVLFESEDAATIESAERIASPIAETLAASLGVRVDVRGSWFNLIGA